MELKKNPHYHILHGWSFDFFSLILFFFAGGILLHLVISEAERHLFFYLFNLHYICFLPACVKSLAFFLVIMLRKIFGHSKDGVEKASKHCIQGPICNELGKLPLKACIHISQLQCHLPKCQKKGNRVGRKRLHTSPHAHSLKIWKELIANGCHIFICQSRSSPAVPCFKRAKWIEG